MWKGTHRHASGGRPTPTYISWIQMRQRCNNKNAPNYHNYGGRGITICSDWNDFECFLKDMGERKSIEYSLDRIDNNGNYEPNNCRWATQKEQGNNQRTNVILDFYGTSKTVSEWSRIVNINKNTLYDRIYKGWSIFKALTTPAKDTYIVLELDGIKRTIAQWSRHSGIKEATLHSRLNYGWNAERVLTTPLRSWAKGRKKP